MKKAIKTFICDFIVIAAVIIFIWLIASIVDINICNNPTSKHYKQYESWNIFKPKEDKTIYILSENGEIKEVFDNKEKIIERAATIIETKYGEHTKEQILNKTDLLGEYCGIVDIDEFELK